MTSATDQDVLCGYCWLAFDNPICKGKALHTEEESESPAATPPTIDPRAETQLDLF